MIAVLIIGMGIVDNANKVAQNNPYLNTFYIDTDNYILWFRYFGLSAKINYNIMPAFYSIYKGIRIVFVTFLIVINKILNVISNVF